MPELAKTLILVGAFFVLAGIALLFAGKIPGVGRLPGDILIRKENFTFYFPLMTSVLISLVLTALLSLIRRK